MLSKENSKKLSKLMTKMLRHDPLAFGIALDPGDGSTEAEELLRAVRRLDGWEALTMEQIREVVRDSDKQRFELFGDRIRARYGHSHSRVGYAEGTPPAVLYHGTSGDTAPVLLREGIRPMGRQYVHLSEGRHFATLAGSRKGRLAIVAVNTAVAMRAGVKFYIAGNEVWLADFVPPSCCKIETNGEGGYTE